MSTTKVIVLVGDPNRGTEAPNTFDGKMLADWINDMQLTNFNVFRSGSAAALNALSAPHLAVVACGRDAQHWAMRNGGGRTIDMPYPGTDNPTANNADTMRRKLYRARKEIERLYNHSLPKESKIKVVK